jgi:hypothetical protein
MAMELPPRFAQTRATVHRIATHVLARRRFEVSGRFGLRAAPGGMATPAFGDDTEVLRTAGITLVRERGATSASVEMPGTTLRQLAAFAGTDIDRAFSAGSDTVGLDDPDAPLELDLASMSMLARWFTFGWTVLDTVLATLPAAAQPATVQLWPEHFDAGTTVVSTAGISVNLGFSAGDDFEVHPYAYVGPHVGPHGGERGGDPAFWNAPFGAAFRFADIAGSPDAFSAAADFLRTGLRHVGSRAG